MPLPIPQNVEVQDIGRQVEASRQRIVKRAAELCEQGLRGPLSFWPWRSGRSRQSLRVVPATSKVAADGAAYDVVSNVPYARWVNRAATASPNSSKPNLNRYVVGSTLQALWPQIVAQLGGQASYDETTTAPAPKALAAGPQPEPSLDDTLSSLFGSAFFKDALGQSRKARAKRSYRVAQQQRDRKNRLARERYKRRAAQYDLLVKAGDLTGGILSPRYTDRPGRSKTGRQAVRGRVGGDELLDAALIKRRIDRKLHRPLRPARRFLRRHKTARVALRRVANLTDTQVTRLAKPVVITTPTRAVGLRLNEHAVRQLRESARVARRHINRA